MSEEVNAIATEAETEDKIGNVKISVDVIATVASIATNEIKGVAGMSGTALGGIADILGGKRSRGKGVKVDVSGDTCVIDLNIAVNYGVRIPDIAWDVQENVKNSVESMTGMTVSKVNIHVDGINFDNEDELTQEPAPEAETAE